MFDVRPGGSCFGLFGDRLLVLFFVGASSNEASCVLFTQKHLKQMFFFLSPSHRNDAVGFCFFEKYLVAVWFVALISLCVFLLCGCFQSACICPCDEYV